MFSRTTASPLQWTLARHSQNSRLVLTRSMMGATALPHWLDSCETFFYSTSTFVLILRYIAPMRRSTTLCALRMFSRTLR